MGCFDGFNMYEIFFSILNLKYKQKPFRWTSYSFLWQNAAFLSVFEVDRFLKKPVKNRSQKKNFLRSIFFDFSKNLFKFKKAQRSRFLSPGALRYSIRKVFIYSSIWKWKKNYSTILIPTNPPLFRAQKHVFLKFFCLCSISTYQKRKENSIKKVAKISKNIFSKTKLPKLSNELFSVPIR